ncbi:sensor histidine kinase [Streptomyces spectabilis]|uniref:histidine kinase n=1 Tax=Streptomyces spectabilis TaxID=68270 RepID=A0A5P2WXH3_STRST|nr:sensor histidine kinase [Streptomyces spectabilis]MBB5108878.1 signal transduction histidine kinase [Streptomyces spectabilis]MCI3899828.1 sensor histidine kinase [Streptomyces spectabilis]QEV57487.1 sensor histidine kinase [Streptomyces spectabilis]GGV42674.1 two-component sensor histidine kinase [Streptomyces spectabilis]
MIADIRSWARRHPRAFDAATAAALCALAVLSTTMAQPPRIVHWPPPAAATVAALACAALLARRSRPRLTVITTTACTAALGAMGPALGYEFGSTLTGPVMAALASLAWHTDSRTAARYTATSALALLAASALWPPGGPQLRPEQVGLAAFILVAPAVADSLRSRRDYVTAVEARAEMALRTREEEARRRVGAERMRIARELHDVVAHHITLAHAQAATADYLLASRPDKAQQVMHNLTATLNSALGELRSTVGLLRERDEPSGPSREPAPGLARLPDLIASFDQVGLTVTLTQDGAEQPLSPGVDLTAYRITQEALTNVSKHALTTTAAVHLHYTDDLLTLTVTDDGPPVQVRGAAGYGLIGMHERAQAAGGHLHARPRDDTGFEVRVELPTLAPPARPSAHDEDTL